MNYPHAGQTQRLDRQPGAKFAWEIEYHVNEDRALCLPVLGPDNVTILGYLVFHAIRTEDDGGYIGLSTSKSARYDVYAKESFNLNHQRNPNRAQGDGDDGQDDGA